MEMEINHFVYFEQLTNREREKKERRTNVELTIEQERTKIYVYGRS